MRRASHGRVEWLTPDGARRIESAGRTARREAKRRRVRGGLQHGGAQEVEIGVSGLAQPYAGLPGSEQRTGSRSAPEHPDIVEAELIPGEGAVCPRLAFTCKAGHLQAPDVFSPDPDPVLFDGNVF